MGRGQSWCRYGEHEITGGVIIGAGDGSGTGADGDFSCEPCYKAYQKGRENPRFFAESVKSGQEPNMEDLVRKIRQRFADRRKKNSEEAARKYGSELGRPPRSVRHAPPGIMCSPCNGYVHEE